MLSHMHPQLAEFFQYRLAQQELMKELGESGAALSMQQDLRALRGWYKLFGQRVGGPILDMAEVSDLVARRFGDGPGAEGVGAIEEAVRRVVVELGSPQAPGVREGLSERARAGLEHSVGSAGWTPVLAFGGAPFTLAAYLVEGRPSRDHLAARTLMRADPDSWDRLMTWCARLTGEFIAIQVRAGAAAAQLFDSWAGSLSPRAYRERVAPYSALALDVARQAVSPTTGEAAPLIHFGTGTARLLGLMRQAGADAVGVDERIELGEAIEALAEADPQAGACPVQGNLDPALLAAPWPILAEEVDAVLAAGRAAPGHVVNLGHGVPPATDADVLTRIVARVHGSADWEAVALAGWDAVADPAEGKSSSTEATGGRRGVGQRNRHVPGRPPRPGPATPGGLLPPPGGHSGGTDAARVLRAGEAGRDGGSHRDHGQGHAAVDSAVLGSGGGEARAVDQAGTARGRHRIGAPPHNLRDRHAPGGPGYPRGPGAG